MKKNVFLSLFALFVALIGVVVALVAFFKRKRAIIRDDLDDIPDIPMEDEENYDDLEDRPIFGDDEAARDFSTIDSNAESASEDGGFEDSEEEIEK